MPIYEYECTACAHHLEKMQKMSDPPLTHCPQCHQETLRKLISAAGFQLKGTGWYATDFKQSGKPKETKSSESSAESKSASTDTASKPACADGACKAAA